MRALKSALIILLATTPLWAGYVSYPPAPSSGGGGGGGGTGWDGSSTLAAPLTGFVTSAGDVTAADTVLSAIEKLDGNVDGVSAFATAQLLLKEDVVNKDTDVVLAANSDVKYPSQKAVKTYIDNNITGVSTFATAQLLLKEDVANKDNDPGLTADSATLYPTQHAVKSYADGVSTFAAAGLALKEDVANKDTDVTLAANSDVKYPSQKAVKAYVDVVGASTLGTPLTFAGFNTFGDLDPIPSWTFLTSNGATLMSAYSTYAVPVDGTPGVVKVASFETEWNAANNNTDQSLYATSFDSHFDRTHGGNDITGVVGINVAASVEGSGTVTNHSAVNINQNLLGDAGGTTTNAYGLALSSGTQAGYSLGTYRGVNLSFNGDAASTVGDVTLANMGSSSDLTGTFKGINLTSTGATGTDFNGVVLGSNGAVGGNLNVISSATTGAVTGNYNGLFLSHTGDTANYSGLNLSRVSGNSTSAEGARIDFGPGTATGKTAMSILMGNGATTNSGRIMEASWNTGTYDNRIGINIDGGSGNITTSDTGLNLSSSSGTTPTYVGASIVAEGTMTNFAGVNVSASGGPTVTNVNGIISDVSGITSPNQKIAGNFSGGKLVSSSPLSTGTITPAPFFDMNNIGSDFIIDAGFPTANPGFGNSLGGVFQFNDDMTADAQGLGYSYNGFIGAIGGAAGKTVDTFNFFVGGASDFGAGGTIDKGYGYRMAGILPGGGLAINNFTAFHADAFLDLSVATNKWGFRSDSTTANNAFAKNVVVGAVAGQPTNASVGIEIQSTTKALLLSRMTTAQRLALTAVAGMQVYDTDLTAFYCYTTVWANCGSASGSSTFSGGWSTLGNSGLDDTVNFIGTTDGQDLVLKTNNAENVRIDNTTGFVGIGTNAPTVMLDTTGNIRVRGLTIAGPVSSDVNGNLTSTSVLSIAQGGTNSGAALTNNRVMISSGGSVIEHTALTADRVLYTDGNGLPAASTVSATELGYLSGVTSSIQTQLDSKLSAVTSYAETPAGAVDDVNVTFTPLHTPTDNAGIVLTLDGVVVAQEAGADGYTMGGSVITMGTAPSTGQKIRMIFH